MVRVEATDDAATLLDDGGTWDRLAGGCPLRETAWLGHWWRYLGRQDGALILVATDPGGQIVGLLPLVRDVGGGGRTLRNWGHGAVCTDHVSPLVASDNAQEIAHAIGHHLGRLADSRRHGWDHLEIDGITEGDAAATALAAGLRDAGISLHAHSRMHTWYRPCQPSWDACLETFSRNTRSRFRRLLRRCDAGGDLTLRLAESETEFRRDLDHTISLHQARWNAEGLPGAFADDSVHRFFTAAALDLFRHGRFCLLTLWRDDRPIAGSLNLVGADRRLYLYNTGMDPAERESEPGILLNVALLRYAHRHPYEGVDYLRGDEPYKARLRAAPRRQIVLRGTGPRWLARCRHALWLSEFGIKQAVRRGRGRAAVAVVNPVAIPATPIVPPAASRPTDV